jgi:murein DD-endopeptidase MepM/ murein hydrolase activator NlpD
VIVFPTLGPLATATPTTTNLMGMSCPNPDCVFLTPSSVGTAEPLRFDLPTPGREPISAWRPPQYAVPLALGPFDHFYFARPIGADQVNWPIADYRYGGTFLDKTITHTGVDIPAKAGTPVLAAGPGTVVWAGWGLFGGTPGNVQDPYGIAVAIRHDFGYQGQPLFTVYAHMSKVIVAPGEWVDTGTQLGNVGSTGATTGPHLHFEVRLGENSYYFTRNPELWVAPPQGWGVLAGRIMRNDGKPMTSTVVAIDALSVKREWLVNTYGPGPANPDTYYNENMVISDLPAGDYRVQVIVEGQAYQLKLKVFPGRVTFFSMRGTYGFSTKPPPIPAIFTATPTPLR